MKSFKAIAFGIILLSFFRVPRTSFPPDGTSSENVR